MRIRESKKYFVLCCMLGFLLGILYANLVAKDSIANMGIFNEFFLNQYVQTELDMGEYAWYLIRVRVMPLVLLLAVGSSRFRKGAVIVFLLWTGFGGGIILTSGIIKMGIKGVILCLVSLMPHFLCYVGGYAILLWHLFTYPESRWNASKMVCFGLLFAMGLLLECYVNPVLMKLFLKTL